MAAARSRDPVLAKIRLMWVLVVWLLRYRRPAGDEAEDFHLAVGQAVGRRGPGRLGRGRRQGGREQRVVDPGGEDGEAAGRGPQGPGDVGPVSVLGEVTAGPGPQGVQDGVVV